MLRWNFSIPIDQDLGFHMNYWNSWKKLHKILQKTLLYSFCSIVLNPVSCRVEWVISETYRIFRQIVVNKTFLAASFCFFYSISRVFYASTKPSDFFVFSCLCKFKSFALFYWFIICEDWRRWQKIKWLKNFTPPNLKLWLEFSYIKVWVRKPISPDLMHVDLLVDWAVGQICKYYYYFQETDHYESHDAIFASWKNPRKT